MYDPVRRRFGGMPTWETWWLLARTAHLLPPSAAVVTPGAEPAAGPRRPGASLWTAEDAAREQLAEARVVPYLVATVHPSSGAEETIRAAAAVSLGRVARSPAAVAVLMTLLEDSREDAEVRAAAALGLGLLGRSREEFAFSADLLDRVRARLLAAFDDATATEGVRTACALALGLLGDQAFGDGFLLRDGRLTVYGLRERLLHGALSEDVRCALIAALSMQPAAGVPEGVRYDLRRVALGARASGFCPSAAESEAAILACGRLWGPSTAHLFEQILASRRRGSGAHRAVVFGMASRVDAMDAETREDVDRMLEKHMPDARDPVAYGMAQIVLGRLVAKQMRAGSADGAGVSSDAALLLRQATDGTPATRAFSAFALAVACAGLGGDDATETRFRDDARSVLLRGAAAGAGRSDLRAAYLAALGLWPRARAQEVLEAAVLDRDERPALRGYAAVALAQSAWNRPRAERAVGIALAEKTSPDLRADAALALAFLAARTGTDSDVWRLVRELKAERTDAGRTSLVVALAWQRDPAVADVLQSLSDDPEGGIGVRAAAVLALGRLADPEPLSILTRVASGSLLPPWLEQRLHDALAGI